MPTVFDYPHYRDYLASRLGAPGTRGGLKKKAAESLRVHTTLISQILSGRCEISLEQAENMNRFLEHSEEESGFFLLLVLHERSSTKILRERFARQIEVERKRRLILHRRVGRESKISAADEERFYATPIHSAIHVLVSIPRLRTREALASALGMPRGRVAKAVAFLLQLGVLREVDGLLGPGSRHIHLGADSVHVSRHHLNWRLKAIERIREAPERDLHYSAVVSLSEEDVARIKESLLKNLSENAKVITRSREEAAYVYCFDFFRLDAGD